jgi:hypothetical protein
MSSADCDEWLASRAWLAHPGIPLWLCVPTQFGTQSQRQAAALAAELVPQQQVNSDHVASLVELAVARSMRGVLFASASPLDEENPQAHQRATLLQLANRHLELVEPWLAGGKAVSRINSAAGDWSGVVLHVDRARLLIPMKSERESASRSRSPRAPASSSAGEEIAFVVPGVPESTQVFLLSPVSFQPLPVRRIAGGTQIVVPSGAGGMVLITEDPQVVRVFRERVVGDGPEFMRLSRTLATQRVALIDECDKRLALIGRNSPEARRRLEQAHAQLRQIDTFLATRRIEPAYRLTHDVLHQLDQAADDQRRAALGPAAPLRSLPLGLSYDGLVDCAHFLRTYRSLRGGENLLYGGDFEDLGRMMQFGWQHVNHPTPGIQASARLSTREPKHGTYCLELFAAAESTQDRPRAVESAPVWVVSPPVPVQTDQIVEITGWVRVEEPIAGSVDGLQIADTLGGGELSLALRHTSAWQPFQIIRGVPQATELRLTFALSGLGTAAIDGVMIRTLAQPIARRLPTTSPTKLPDSTKTASRPRPLFVAPQAR